MPPEIDIHEKENVMKRTLMIGAALAAGVFATLAMAQDKSADCPMDMSKMDHSNMGGMMMSGEPKGDQGPSSQAFAKANAAMHGAMDIEFTGNADVDFAKGMIPHHQGAIDMAKIVLEHGKDPELRALAEGVIKAQESEIAFMNAWLAKNAK
jgi:uncharacterized protein (DUF305 family)